MLSKADANQTWKILVGKEKKARKRSGIWNLYLQSLYLDEFVQRKMIAEESLEDFQKSSYKYPDVVLLACL